jgi:WD40-like Beta Propeller Repeat
MKQSALFLTLLLFLTSCPDARKYRTGYFQDDVVNFSDVNSEYDDYNMDSPDINSHSLFHFSSNRNSQGGNFDIVGEKMYIDWSKTEGSLSIGTDLNEDWFDYLIPLFDSVNTPCNELGPYTLDYREELNSTGIYTWTDLLLYANDCSGDFDVKFICCEMTDSLGSEKTIMQPPKEISFINTGANELYPSFYGSGFYKFDEWGQDPGKIEKMLFCSDRNGNYDIFEINLPEGMDINRFLNADFNIEPDSLVISPLSLNSGSDDKCPYVNGKLLVFASNRPGGYGGFDLYYSIYNDGTWSEPVNFGEKINSPYDEYRPVTIHHDQFANNLLIFSSNRPGGKGGFDLYHVGITQMIR